MSASRRQLLRGAAVAGGAGIGLLAWEIGGRTEWLSPREARTRGVPLAILKDDEATLIEAFAEVLLPGAREAGIAAFVDHQLARPAADSLLMLRYLGVDPPYAGFYRAGLAALDTHARATAGQPFADLDAGRAAALVGAIAQAPPPGWSGPPSPLLYFAIRADAIDVVYGTEDGFRRLGVRYMAHVPPQPKW